MLKLIGISAIISVVVTIVACELLGSVTVVELLILALFIGPGSVALTSAMVKD